MLNEVYRSNIVSQSYLRTDQAGGFQRENVVKCHLSKDTAFISRVKGKQTF